MARASAIEAEVIGDIAAAVNAGLDAIAPAAQLVRESIYRRAQGNQAVLGVNTPYGDRWARQRTSKGLQTGNPDLWFTGRMFSTLAVRSPSGQIIDTSGKGSTFRDPSTGRWARREEVTIGFEEGKESLKAAVHQFGTQGKPGKGNNVPARPFIGFTQAEIDLVEKEVLNKISLVLDVRRTPTDIELKVF